MPKAPLIVFSGLDCAGKTTQINLLVEHLRASGAEPVYCWSRGGYTPLFLAAKSLLRRLSGRALPPAGRSRERAQALSKNWVRGLWLSASLLDLALVYGLALRWWRLRGRTVVCDRYLWDTLVDFRLNFPQEKIEKWWMWRLLAAVAPAADASFLLLVPVAESLRRSALKDEPFPDAADVLVARLACYESQIVEGRWHVLDGRRPVRDLFAEIKERVEAIGVSRSNAVPTIESSSTTA